MSICYSSAHFTKPVSPAPAVASDLCDLDSREHAEQGNTARRVGALHFFRLLPVGATENAAARPAQSMYKAKKGRRLPTCENTMSMRRSM